MQSNSYLINLQFYRKQEMDNCAPWALALAMHRTVWTALPSQWLYLYSVARWIWFQPFIRPRPRLLCELWDLSNSKSSLCVLPKVLLAHILIIYNQVLQPHQPHHLLLRWGGLSTQFGLCSKWRCWSQGWKGSKATEAPQSTMSGQSAGSSLAHVDEVGVLVQHANPKDEWQQLLWCDQLWEDIP